MSLSNLATVFGPTLMRPPVASLDQCGPTVDISQEVEVQVSSSSHSASRHISVIYNTRRMEAALLR